MRLVTAPPPGGGAAMDRARPSILALITVLQAMKAKPITGTMMSLQR